MNTSKNIFQQRNVKKNKETCQNAQVNHPNWIEVSIQIRHNGYEKACIKTNINRHGTCAF
jgi:hypothetical protein